MKYGRAYDGNESIVVVNEEALYVTWREEAEGVGEGKWRERGAEMSNK